jgi:hypothetical protein
MKYLKITNMPIRSLIKMDGNAIVLNTNYELTVLKNVSVENLTQYYGEPFDSFKYKIYSDNVESINEGTVTVNFETNKVGMPPQQNAIKDLMLFDTFFFSEVISPEQHYDRIVITSIVGKGFWTYNNIPVVLNQELFYYNLVNNLKFVANQSGVENNYSILTYRTKNVLAEHNQDNTVSINTNSTGAQLILNGSTAEGSVAQDGLETLTYNFSIINSISNANYELKIDTTFYPSFGTDLLSEIDITERNLPTETLNKSTGPIYTLLKQFDANGQTVYNIVIRKKTTTTFENKIIVDLVKINDSTLGIDPLYDSIELIIPATPDNGLIDIQ